MDVRRSMALTHIAYHAWATQKTLDSVEPLSAEQLHRDMQSSHGGVCGTLEHIYQADEIWLARFHGNAGARLDQFHSAPDLAAFRAQWADTHRRYETYINGISEEELGDSMDYRLMSGMECRSPIFENLIHVANHGTYHRGQIVTMLRQIGAKPVATDFVHYVRTRG